jgi:hypothetical protein
LILIKDSVVLGKKTKRNKNRLHACQKKKALFLPDMVIDLSSRKIMLKDMNNINKDVHTWKVVHCR